MPRTNCGGGASPPARPPRRTRYPDLSPTRAPAVEADRAPWPLWADVPIEFLGLVLVDGHGVPVHGGRAGA